MNKLLIIIFKYLHSIFYFLLILLGTTMITWIIWVRFIRERLPKDIPFELTEISFYVLLYVCCIYLYIIKSLLIPKETNPIITKIIKILYTPLVTLDESVKNNKLFFKLYNKILIYAIIRVDSFTYSQSKMIYICYNILPRAFLVTLLSINVFYFHRLELIYDFIFIGLIPLLHRYIKYSFKHAKEQYIKTLNIKYDEVVISNIN